MKTKQTSNDIDKKIGQCIKERRVFLNLFAKEIANALDITVAQLAKYEKGINKVAANKLPILAQILEVPITYFFEEDKKKEVIDEITLELRSFLTRDEEVKKFIEGALLINERLKKGKQ